jgi:hypothetical protein
VGESVWRMDSKIATMHWWRTRIATMTLHGQLRSNHPSLFLSTAPTSGTSQDR